MRLLRYFHRKVPVDSLCLYRAAVGLLIFCEFAYYLPYSRELFSSEGFHVPLTTWLPVPSPLVASLMCLALMGFSLMLMLGLLTRVAVAGTLFFWTYFYGLDAINEKAVQTIMIVVLSFLFFSACGNRYSLDNYFRRKRGLEEYPAETSIFILRLLRFEFANVYFFSGLAKITYPEWINGTTIARLLNGRWANPLGIYLSAFDFDLPARIGGLATVLFELFEGFLLLTPTTRYYAIVLGLLFHTGIQMTLWIGTLGLHFMIALIFLFPEPEWIAKLAGNFRKRCCARGFFKE